MPLDGFGGWLFDASAEIGNFIEISRACCVGFSVRNGQLPHSDSVLRLLAFSLQFESCRGGGEEEEGGASLEQQLRAGGFRALLQAQMHLSATCNL